MKTTYAMLILLLPCGFSAFAQYTNKSSVLDGSGVIASGGGYTNISATGQPGGITQTMAGTLPLNAGTIVNQAGFLNTFCLRPNLCGGHGVPVEIDPDNDGDGLGDTAEITGSSFNPATPTDPNNPDTCGSGMCDGEKAVAGVNPLDPNAEFCILALTNAAGARYLAWRAHGNNERTYVVYSTTNAMQPYSTVVFSNTVAGGSYPWYVTTNIVSDVASPNGKFYSVTVSQ